MAHAGPSSSAAFWSGTSSPPPPSSSSAVAGTSSLAAYDSIGVTRSRTLLFLSYRDSAPRGQRLARRRDLDASQSAGTSSDHDPLGVTGRASGSGTNSKRQNGGLYFDFDEEDESDRLQKSHRQDDDGGEEESSALLNDRYSLDGSTTTGTTFRRRRRDETVIDIPSLPPRWVDASDQIDAIISSLSPPIATLDRLQAKHLLPGFVDRSQEEREIARLQGEITREFRKCSKLIAGLAQELQRQQQQPQTRPNQQGGLSAGSTMSKEEATLARNVQTALAQRVQDASGQFRKKQSNYMQRLKGQDVRHREVMGELGLGPKNHRGDNQGIGGSSGEARAEELAAREDMELSRAHLAGQQQQQRGRQSQEQLLLFESEQSQQTDVDADVAKRHAEITSIASSIVELSQLFQDLQTLVIDQGSLVDRIDYNIETMGRDMVKANEELQVATKTQRRTGRGQCILFLVLLCALLVAVIIVKPFWRLFAEGADRAASVSATSAAAAAVIASKSM